MKILAPFFYIAPGGKSEYKFIELTEEELKEFALQKIGKEHDLDKVEIDCLSFHVNFKQT